MNRKDCLDEAIKCVCQDRQNTYGSPEKNFKVIADYWTVFLQSIGYEVTVLPWHVAVMMSQLKTARMASSPNHLDNYVDGCGYLANACELVGDRVVGTIS